MGVLEHGLLASQFQEVQHKIDHAFATKWEGEDMSLKELVSKYHMYYKRGFKYFTNCSIFAATLGGFGPDATNSLNCPDPEAPSPCTNLDSNKRSCMNCVCSLPHCYSTCWYFVPSVQPTNWKENPETCKKVNNLLATNEKLREKVEKALQLAGVAAEIPDNTQPNSAHYSA